MLKIKVKGDIHVCVPDTIQLMTPYILLEQEDWFEDEIKFLRHAAKPGMNVIDIGANYGLYTLTLGKHILPDGNIWAFEPASRTAGYLAQSIDANRLGNIQLIQAALSEKKGQARLSLYPNAEINSLLNQGNAPDTETVELLTLDDCALEYGWKDIDFIKLDAEGEEQRIILGGMQFLTEQSPLIMFELKHGDTVNQSLIDQFAGLGYTPYRLMPGLQLLAPLDAQSRQEPFLLNVFCCKPDRAQKLESQGLLTRYSGKDIPCRPAEGMHLRKCISGMPYYRTFRTSWDRAARKQTVTGQDRYSKALLLYFTAHMSTPDIPYRGACLEQSGQLMEQALAQDTNLSRLQTYSRVMYELGNRAKAVQVLNDLLSQISPETRIALPEPFLPVSPRFDQIPLSNKAQVTEWCLSSIIEQFEKLQAYSSFYIEPPEQLQKMLTRLDYHGRHAFRSAEMERRRQLVSLRHGYPHAADLAGLLTVESKENLNAGIWRDGPLTGHRDTNRERR